MVIGERHLIKTVATSLLQENQLNSSKTQLYADKSHHSCVGSSSVAGTTLLILNSTTQSPKKSATVSSKIHSGGTTTTNQSTKANQPVGLCNVLTVGTSFPQSYTVHILSVHLFYRYPQAERRRDERPCPVRKWFDLCVLHVWNLSGTNLARLIHDQYSGIQCSSTTCHVCCEQQLYKPIHLCIYECSFQICIPFTLTFELL